jgi:hypothetical protein
MRYVWRAILRAAGITAARRRYVLLEAMQGRRDAPRGQDANVSHLRKDIHSEQRQRSTLLLPAA